MEAQYPFNRLPINIHPELSIVIPIYNESETLEALLKIWSNHFSDMQLSHEFVVVNDGSTDGTGRLLDKLRKEYSTLRIVHQLNSGHGRAVRRGYEMARGKYILQLDSNGRFEPEDFNLLWEERDRMRLVSGHRMHRLDSLPRQLLSTFLRLATKFLFRVELSDPNVSFRLFEREPICKFLKSLPQSWQSPNLAMSVYAAKELKDRVKEVKIPFRHRTRGKSTVAVISLWGIALDYFNEMLSLRVILSPKAQYISGLIRGTQTN